MRNNAPEHDEAMKAMWLRLAAVLGSGAGTALLFPPYDFGGLVWLVMLPLMVALWTLRGRRIGWKALGLGWLWGFAGFAMGFFWLTEVTSIGWFVVTAYLSLYPALWAVFAVCLAHPWRSRTDAADPDEQASGIAGKMREKLEKKSKHSSGDGADGSHWRASWRSIVVAFAVAAVWCGTEWLRGWVFTGFGWNSLGVAFHRTPVMAQSADLFGVIGLSFLPVFLQAVLVQTGMRLWREARVGRLRAHVDFGVAVALIALAFLYGVWRLHSVGDGESQRIRMLLVQLNIPQDAAVKLWSPEEIHFAYEDETLAALDAIEADEERRMVEAIESNGRFRTKMPDWIIWPESALPGNILRHGEDDWGTTQDNFETLSRIGERGDFMLAMGLNEIEGKRMGDLIVEKSGARIWNSLVVFDDDQDLVTYRKNHLVIFGEYIPFADDVPFLQKIYEQQSGAQYGGAFSKGGRFDPLEIRENGEGTSVIPSICFEDTVPRLMRKFVRGKPQWMLNVTNDGWFRDSPAAAQHFANARFRAIELRRPLVRSANNGVSAVVDVRGGTGHPDTGEPQEIRDEQGSHLTRGWLLAEVDVPQRPATTLYLIIGDAGVIGLGVMGLFAGLWYRLRFR